LIDQFLEVLACFEIRNALGGNADRLAGLGITATPGAAAPHTETAKAAQFDLLALIQTLNNAIENDLDQPLSVFLSQLSGISYVIDKIGFSHAVTSSKSSESKDERAWMNNVQDGKKLVDRVSDQTFHGKAKPLTRQ